MAPDQVELARRAADHLVALLARPAPPAPLPVALSGGTTPRRLYSLLASDEYRARIPWERVHVFFADERCVPPDHPESNYAMAHELLLSRIGLPAGNVHPMRGGAEDAERAAREYEAEMRAVCPAAGGAPVLDVILLGVGDDGHTASLFPGTEALREARRWVVANYVPKLRATRLTLTYPVLMAAWEVVFLVAGAGKAEVVRCLTEGQPGLPAARVFRGHRNVVAFVDAAAAAGIPVHN